MGGLGTGIHDIATKLSQKRDRCWSGEGNAAFEAGQGFVDGLPAAGEALEQLDLGWGRWAEPDIRAFSIPRNPRLGKSPAVRE